MYWLSPFVNNPFYTSNNKPELSTELSAFIIMTYFIPFMFPVFKYAI